MRLWLRLTLLGLMLGGLALALVHLRAETVSAGNRLHELYGQKRQLGKECYRLRLAIARLKTPDRLEAEAAELMAPPEDVPHGPVREAPPGPCTGEIARRPGLVIPDW